MLDSPCAPALGRRGSSRTPAQPRAACHHSAGRGTGVHPAHPCVRPGPAPEHRSRCALHRAALLTSYSSAPLLSSHLDNNRRHRLINTEIRSRPAHIASYQVAIACRCTQTLPRTRTLQQPGHVKEVATSPAHLLAYCSENLRIVSSVFVLGSARQSPCVNAVVSSPS